MVEVKGAGEGVAGVGDDEDEACIMRGSVLLAGNTLLGGVASSTSAACITTLQQPSMASTDNISLGARLCPHTGGLSV